MARADEVRRILFEFAGDAKELVGDSKDAAKGLDSVDKSATSTASTLSKKLKPAAIAAGAAAAGMAAKWAVDGIQMAQTAEVAAESFDKVFGTAAEGLTEDMDDVRLALGLSTAEFQKQVTAIGAVSKSLHQTDQEAADFAASMLTVAADVAAFNGDLASAPHVIEAMNSALIGNTESLEAYGIEVTAAMVETRALADSGKSAASELTQLEKREASMALITEQAALMTGSLNEQLDDATVKSNQFSARMKDVQTSVGAALLPLKELVLELLLAMVPILEALNPLISAFGSIIAKVAQLVTPLIRLIGELITKLVELGVKAAETLDKLNPLKAAGRAVGNLFSFDSGGTVPGPTGSRQMVALQGGEQVLSASQAKSRNGGGGGPATVVNVTVQAGLSSPQDTARTIVDLLEVYTQTNGAVNIKTNGG